MKKIGGIALILIGVFSGGIGIGIMGGGLAVPAFLVVAFGIYLLFSSSQEKAINKNQNKKKISSIFLGILILIFGFINLFNGSLVMISLILIIIGGGLIYYYFSRTEENINKPKDLKSRIRQKVEKKEPIKKKSKWTFLIYALGIPGVLIFLIMLMSS